MSDRFHTSTPAETSAGIRSRPGHVTILLATLNGARFLQAQLESYRAQTHRDWSLIASDDGSDDGTIAILQAFQRDNPDRLVTVLRGPGKGSAQNFLSLLRAAGPADLVAFSDQDDVWLPGKLDRAVGGLHGHVRPTLYCSRTAVTGPSLEPIGTSPDFARAPGFANALVQHIAGGNTMVLNRAALDMLQPASLLASRTVSHDWWCYQMVTGAGGRVLFDRRPGLCYRQHGRNQIGANRGWRARLARLQGLFFERRFSGWMDENCAALSAAEAWLEPGARRRLRRVVAARRSRLPGRILGLLRAGVYRQGRCGTAALWLAALTGRF